MKWPDAFRELTMVKVTETEFGVNEARRSISPKPTSGPRGCAARILIPANGNVLYHSILRLASPHQVLRRFVRDAGSVNQALSPFGLMITVDRAARLPETTEIRSALPASKSIPSQIAAMSCAHSFALTALRNSPP